MTIHVNPRMHKYWPLVLAIGLMNALIGFEIFMPMFQGEAIFTLVGIVILLGAVFATIVTFFIGHKQGRIYGIAAIIIRLVTAFLLLFDPMDRHFTFTTLLGVFFGLDGALLCGEAARLRRLKISYASYLAMGITSVVFSASLWTFEEGGSYTAISDILSVTFWIRAVVLILTAWKLRQALLDSRMPDQKVEAENLPPVAEL